MGSQRKSTDDASVPITRAVGRFFGHIFQSVKNPAPDSDRREVSRETQEAHGEMGAKKVVLRRTTIEEIEMKDE